MVSTRHLRCPEDLQTVRPQPISKVFQRFYEVIWAKLCKNTYFNWIILRHLKILYCNIFFMRQLLVSNNMKNLHSCGFKIFFRTYHQIIDSLKLENTSVHWKWKVVAITMIQFHCTDILLLIFLFCFQPGNQIT